MFGIDLGITVSSVMCISENNEIIDHEILFGDKKEEDQWKRIVEMSEAICEVLRKITKFRPEITIEELVSIEEPVFPYRTRNPKSYFNMCCLYALVRKRLMGRGYTIYSVHPLTVKATAKAHAFGRKKLRAIYMKHGTLTKKGMIRAFMKITGDLPDYHTMIGKETLADAFFIARTGLDRRKAGIRSE